MTSPFRLPVPDENGRFKDKHLPERLAADRIAPVPDQFDSLFAKLDLKDAGPVTVAQASDSTGDSAAEYFEAAWKESLATLWPERPARVIRWVKSNDAYRTPEVWQAGVGSPPALVGADTFGTDAVNLAGRVPDTGAGPWEVVNGTWVVDGGGARQTEDAIGSAGFPLLTRTTPDGTYEAVFELVGTGSTQVATFVPILGQASVAGDRLFVDIMGSAMMTANLKIVVGGTSTTLATKSDVATINTSGPTTVTVVMVVDGLNVTVTINGTQAVTATLTEAQRSALTGQYCSFIMNKTHQGRLASVTLNSGKESPQNLHPFTAYNGGWAGGRIEENLTRIDRMYPVRPDVMFINHGHNYSSIDKTPEVFIQRIDEFVDALHAKYPDVPIVIVSQNPKMGDTNGQMVYVNEHRDRQMALRDHARRKGWGYIPAYEAFMALPDGGRSRIEEDGTHPTVIDWASPNAPTGARLMADTAKSWIAQRSRRSGTVSRAEAAASYAPASLSTTVARKRGPALLDQPARRLFEQALLSVGSRPIVGVGLGASTWEGSVADPPFQVSALVEKMLQSSFNPPSVGGGYTTKIRNGGWWARSGSQGSVEDVDMKKVVVLNTEGTATHESYQDCTGIDIYYPAGPDIGSWTISIDGGTPVTVDPSLVASANFTGVWRSPVLARGKHRFVITALEDNAQFSNAYIRDQDERAGVRLLNFGRAGGSTAEFLGSSADSTWQRINSIVPDFALVTLGHNNMGRTTPAQLATDLGTICDRLQTAAGRPIWIAVCVQHSTDSRWPAYAEATEQFVAGRPETCTLHSWREFFVDSTAAAPATGDFYEDNLHLNNQGHQTAAAVLADSMRLPSRRTWPVKPATDPLPSIVPGAPDVESGLMTKFTFDLDLDNATPVPSVSPSGGVRGIALEHQPTVSKQPTFLDNAANGHGALHFVRANQQFLRYPTANGVEENPMPATIVMVGRRAVSDAPSGMFVHGGVGQDQVSRALAIEAESASFAFRGNTSTAGNISGGTPDTNWHVVVFVADGANSRLYIDDQALTGTLTDPGDGRNLMSRMTLGANVAGTANYLDGDILEVREYNRALSEEQVTYLRAQLKSRYAI